MRIIMIALLATCLAAPVAEAWGSSKDRKSAGEPRGQTVSGCNHQANDLGVKGKERKGFVERCIARGGNDWRAEDARRSCVERAERQGMRGEAREEFISRCRGYRDDARGDTIFGGRLRECMTAAERAGGTQEQRRRYMEGCMNPPAPATDSTAAPKAAEKRRPDRSVLDEEERRGPRKPGDEDIVKHKD